MLCNSTECHHLTFIVKCPSIRPNACQLGVKSIWREHTGFSSAWFNIHTVMFNDIWKQPNITAGLLQLATEQLYFRSWRLSVLLKGISRVAAEPGESVTYSLSKIRFSKRIKYSKQHRLVRRLLLYQSVYSTNREPFKWLLYSLQLLSHERSFSWLMEQFRWQ